MSIFSVSSVGWKKKKNTIEDIRCNLSQESKIAACTWFEEFFHHSWLLWNSENHELHKCYFIKFDLSVKTWQPAVSQVWKISTSRSKRWLVCALVFNFAYISWSHIWLVMTHYYSGHDGVKFPHRPIVHYAFSSWKQKTVTKTIHFDWENRFVLQ